MWLEHCVKFLHHINLTLSGQASCDVLSVSAGRGHHYSFRETLSNFTFKISKCNNSSNPWFGLDVDHTSFLSLKHAKY